MNPLVLHKFDASPPARAVMMTGHVLGVPFEFVEHSVLEKTNLEPDFVEKNPMHSIPVLEDKDFILADSHAISTYLISKYGADKRSTLYPNDLYDRATIDSRLFFDTAILFPRVREIVYASMKDGITGPTEELTAKVEEAYQMCEAYLNKSKYIALDHFSVADICCGATVTSLNSLIPIDYEKFPKLIEWFGAIHAESCFPEVNSPGVQEFSAGINNIWNNNQSGGFNPMAR